MEAYIKLLTAAAILCAAVFFLFKNRLKGDDAPKRKRARRGRKGGGLNLR